MEYLIIAIVTAYFGYLLYNVRQKDKRRAELSKLVEKRLSRINKHLDYHGELLSCFSETFDISYINYCDEEMRKVDDLIRLNDLDIEEINRL